ncbi:MULTISPECIES: YraN family protein [unclassified Comamonas]|uniref:YraN family protein n=1 Tax=unclassified Comamonas TaxID=2638500 RepID=UPI00309D2BE3
MQTPWKILEKWRGQGPSAASPGATSEGADNSKLRGQQAEDAALHYLQQQGLRLLARNYRTPGRGGGEIDLVMQERDGTVVFVEVRQRQHSGFGGAGGSIGSTKQRRIILAARHYLASLRQQPACRFDAVLVEQEIVWLRAAFDVPEGG